MARTLTPHAAAAAAIRKDLKAAYPTVAFTVRSDSFSGGNSVDVTWTDGPIDDAVEAIVKPYQYGHFDGSIDLYELSNRRDDIPQVKFVQVRRDRSAAAVVALVNRINTYFQVALVVTVEGSRAWIDRFQRCRGAQWWRLVLRLPAPLVL